MLFPTELIFVILLASIALIIGMIYAGYKEGFVVKLLELFSTLLCLSLAWTICGDVSSKLSLIPVEYVSINGTSIDEIFYQLINKIVVFIILFIIFRIFIIFIRPLFKKVNWIPFVGKANQILGSMLGFIQAFLILAVACIVLSSPLYINGKQVLEESKLIYVNDITKGILSKISSQYAEMESIQKMQSPAEKLQKKDMENIYNWLEEYRFDDSEKDEIVEIIKMRSE